MIYHEEHEEHEVLLLILREQSRSGFATPTETFEDLIVTKRE